ncbi:DUF4271 domain-containing protein [Subsaximicrobium wynnwilliamsii]|jgi:hypothetical protein|uniref:DUF4271 domain-containing protein n=1 Tax=Subsaximicrobium wynnwilliamsii TaxID=291179 RepID=A0A5C6ZEG1_9FLAO|nr:DUF4271 domain-containing protein [Subsaximicrobium wynnwilliamsii]TXD82555.1 DUF4271 domain-containing protein [Subsaximicrobium wynnwilliamsii]TXD88198.1 DUF4271 domain-containing protein [Subsaximicrobium wynnwilliamsii]TXE02213.1 DUF4271 domain-containing protein [Subsaximicrobium wynnwilliamsii]
MLREVVSNDWFTIALTVGLVAVALSKYLFAHRYSDFISVLGNSKYLKIYSRDQKFIDGFDALYFVNFIISVAIFAYVCYSTLVHPSAFDLDQFFKLLFGVGVLFLSKVLLERLIGSLFEIDTIIDSYLFQKTTFKNYTGFILLPVNCILIYTLTPSKSLIYGILIVIVIINLVGFISTFKMYQKLLLNNIFYFILYLCALEIGPYLILSKLIIDSNA